MGGWYKVSLEEYACASKVGRLMDRRRYSHVGRNQMMWDLGMQPEDFENDEGKE